jgi:hypothetical protein
MNIAKETLAAVGFSGWAFPENSKLLAPINDMVVRLLSISVVDHAIAVERPSAFPHSKTFQDLEF